ncbi:ergothioneine biosynthesis glutamate--cysteine ligase EgtA [Nocardia asteroides]|uniref:ergothioneine biosynthesis glutamate--cysteine ligase EgtA n=1 Tax=Nocardia asteroides TaxID=1824 RepID=UPI001E327C42|nr:ergothioneine biosynthesis glutamate--cysteine ligase EgtA [Nocardia asteroides]UGT64376.1 ergothioneine biosynthesis glutamate--cysteine ligase EgtA [Nocardia asteroides]
MSVTLEHPEPPGQTVDQEVMSSRAAAEAYVGGVCFKLGPPALIGVELEWLTVQGGSSAYSTDAPRPALGDLAAALGPHAPRSLAPGSPELALPGGSRVTVEPGGQIELSSSPYPDAQALAAALRADAAVLRDLLATRGIRTVSLAADASRPPRRLLELPRYRAMERHFAGIGPFGKLMMCNTAAGQVSVDAGADPAEVAARWHLLHVAGPALVAAFACSPRLKGAPGGVWASQRMRTWLRLDHSRSRPPAERWADPIAGYASWALDVPLLCVRPCGQDPAAPKWTAPPGATFADWLSGALDDEIGRRPATADLDYHLTTLFPPVRASGYLEIRYLDAQPGDAWSTPLHVVEALLSAPAVVAEATALAAPTAGRWQEAAHAGLADPELRAGAEALLRLAAAHSRQAAEIESAAERCRTGRTPHDDDPEVNP